MIWANVVGIALLVACAGIAAALCIPNRFGRALGFLGLTLGALGAVVASANVLGGNVVVIGGIAAVHAIVRLDATSAFFVAVVSAIAALSGIYALGAVPADERHNGRAAAASACLMWLGSVIVCSAGDVWFFLFGWELVALGFYAAIAYGGNAEDAGGAAYYTLVLTHVAGGGIIAALLVLAHAAGSYAIPDVSAAARHLDPAATSVLFVLLLLGFGAKIGLLPLQGWMPYGYPAAPTTVAALMAGGALNIGFYGIVRFLLGMGGHAPLWWGLLLVALGALGAFFGIAWAQAQRDMRALAALSSVENAGLIVVALGIALVGRTLHMPALLGLGLAAAYIQIAAHALAKTLLFLCASGIRTAVGTVSFEALGGLIHRLPLHAAAGIAAGLSLAALPPLGGFAGEWLILETCMQGFRTANAAAEVTLALAGAIVGLSAGIAVVAFVKCIGVALLGAARTPEAAAARERSSPLQLVAIVVLILAVLGIGVATPWYLGGISRAIDGLAHAPTVAAITASLPLIQPTYAGFSSASGLGLGVTIALAAIAFGILVRVIPRPANREAAPWTSGAPYAAWNQYTGTGFANPTRVILHAAVRTNRESPGTIWGHGGDERLYSSMARPFFGLPLALRIANVFLAIAAIIRRTQSGIIAAYLSYILAFAILVLIFYPSIRHW